MKLFKEFIEESYVYHRSDKTNHQSIKKNGITSQEAVADNGKKFKWPINFASSKKDTDGYVDGPSVLYRVKIKDLKDAGKDNFSGYVRTSHDVPVKDIEYLDGKTWKKLSR